MPSSYSLQLFESFMYIEECGYHVLDNVYAVKGRTATLKKDSLLTVAAVSAK